MGWNMTSSGILTPNNIFVGLSLYGFDNNCAEHTMMCEDKSETFIDSPQGGRV